MYKNIYIVIATLAVAILLYLLVASEPKVVYKDVKSIKLDTITRIEQLEPDTIIKTKMKIVYYELPADTNDLTDTVLTFTVNLFKDNSISEQQIDINDIDRYILTKPFESSDSIITKKQDTVINIFSLTIQKPGQFEHQIYFAPDTTLQINATKEIIPEKHWYESQWLSAAGGAIAAILIFMAVK